MATGKIPTAFWLVILVLVGFTSYYYGQHRTMQKLRKSAGIDTVEVQQRKAVVTALNQERDSLISELSEVKTERDDFKNAHGKVLMELRSKPPVYIKTTTVKLAECDSTRAASESYRKEAQLEHMARINCEEVVAIQDTALQNQEEELIAADLRHSDDQAEIKSISADRDKETKRKKAWRAVSGVAITVAAVAVAIVVVVI